MDLLIAIRKDRTLAEVRLERRAKKVLSETFDGLAELFLNDKTDVLDYAPAFRPEEGGVLKLEYKLPPALWDCRQSLPNGIPPVDEDVLSEGIVALVGIKCGSRPRFYFQAVDPRTTLKPERALFFNPKGFGLNESSGLMLPHRIDAIHQGGLLYFISEAMVRRFLDIEKFFVEATDAEIDQLFQSPAFTVDDWPALKIAANNPIRRKLHGILNSNRVLDAQAIQAVAKRIGGKVQMRQQKVVVPTTPKEFRDFVRIIDDAYLESMLDHANVYLTTSKRRLSK